MILPRTLNIIANKEKCLPKFLQIIVWMSESCSFTTFLESSNAPIFFTKWLHAFFNIKWDALSIDVFLFLYDCLVLADIIRFVFRICTPFSNNESVLLISLTLKQWKFSIIRPTHQKVTLHTVTSSKLLKLLQHCAVCVYRNANVK